MTEMDRQSQERENGYHSPRNGNHSPREAAPRSRSRSRSRSQKSRSPRRSRSRSNDRGRQKRSRSGSRGGGGGGGGRRDSRSRSRSPRRRSPRSRSPRTRRTRSRSPRGRGGRGGGGGGGGGRRGYYRHRSMSRSRSRSPYRGSHIRRLRDNPPSSNVIGVFGLAQRTNQQDLEDIFGKYGRIDKVEMILDHFTGQSRGFGFVYFSNTNEAEDAIHECNGMEVDGRHIRCDFSITKRAHSPTPGQYRGRRSDSRRSEHYRDHRDRDYERGRDRGYYR